MYFCGVKYKIMRKKTLHEILSILVRMSKGEDVVEHYKSEKTAKGVRNSIVNYLYGTMNFWLAYQDKSLAKEDRDMFDVMDNNGFLELVSKTKSRGGITAYREINVSIEDAKHDELNKDGAKYGFCYVDDMGFLSGRYLAYCEVETDTGRHSALNKYNELCVRFRNFLKDWYGTYGFGYFYVRYYEASTKDHCTEHSLKIDIKDIEGILAIPNESSIEKKTPASEKQLYWINKKLGVDASGLNKIQAKELLDVLFNGLKNKAGNNPDDVIGYYRNLLEKNKKN